jgi:hypothetical protein
MKFEIENPQFATNVVADSINFGIADASLLIKMIRDRHYARPLSTAIQEYISNAKDANREVGKPDHHIDITLPNLSIPIIRIRDYGIGLSPDRISNVFVNFCSSTKRGSDEFIGGFGIGAKSAWAYTDSFTVTSWFGGIKSVFVAHIGTSATGQLMKISEEASDEETGVEISFAVQLNDINKAVDAVFNATFSWPVLPNYIGEKNVINSLLSIPKPFIETEDFKLYQMPNGVTCRPWGIALGGIGYDLVDGFNAGYVDFVLTKGVCCVFLAGIGELDVPSSRENILSNSKSQSWQAQKFIKLNDYIKKHYVEALQKITTQKGLIEHVASTPIKYKQLQDIPYLGEFVDITSDRIEFSLEGLRMSSYRKKSLDRDYLAGDDFNVFYNDVYADEKKLKKWMRNGNVLLNDDVSDTWKQYFAARPVSTLKPIRIAAKARIADAVYYPVNHNDTRAVKSSTAYSFVETRWGESTVYCILMEDNKLPVSTEYVAAIDAAHARNGRVIAVSNRSFNMLQKTMPSFKLVDLLEWWGHFKTNPILTEGEEMALIDLCYPKISDWQQRDVADEIDNKDLKELLNKMHDWSYSNKEEKNVKRLNYDMAYPFSFPETIAIAEKLSHFNTVYPNWDILLHGLTEIRSEKNFKSAIERVNKFFKNPQKPKKNAKN